jgi:hypothetical protein
VSGDLLAAIRRHDATAVARLLEEHPALRAALDAPLDGYGFGQTALMAAVQQAHRETIDALLRAGADINQKSHWWAGPFHVLDGAAREPGLASFLMDRGAVPEIHHLVQFGMLDAVGRSLDADPALIAARGGDGQLPLHFAQTVEMAELLVSRGADVDARDVDHESTAAQYMVRDRVPVARWLLFRGAHADVLMAAALGDLALLERLLGTDPASIRSRVSPQWFPMRDPRAGGTIYIWTLGGEKGAHEIAREFGQSAAFDALMARSPASLQLAVACQIDDSARARELAGTVIAPDDYAWLTAAASRDRSGAALMMLEAGWPASADRQPTTPLHWAAYHGDARLVRALLDGGADAAARDAKYDGTPHDWAEVGQRHHAGGDAADHAAVLRLLP